MYKPYVYRLTFLHEGKTYYYIGARYRQFGQKAHPSDLLVTYFTSSIYAKAMIEAVGAENVKKKIIMTFDDKKSCQDFEMKLLLRVDAKNSKNFLNRTNGGVTFYSHVLSEETRKKMSLAKKGKKFTEEHKRKLRENHKGNSGKIATEESKAKMSKAQSGKNNGFYGRTHSDESRRKIAENVGSKRPEVKAKMSDSIKRSHALEKPVICPHCNKMGARRQMTRWHFDNCKIKTTQVFPL